MKGVRKSLALLALMLPLVMLGTQKAAAAETETQVAFDLHKIVFPEGEMPEASLNTGDTSGEHADLLSDYRGLNDVTFEAYDVSDQFYQLRQAGKTVEEAQQSLSELADSNLGHALATQKTAVVDGEDGTATFSLPAKTNGKDANYLFHEAAAPAIVKEKAKNMVVVLPVLTKAGEELSTIHLYPKNEEVEHSEPILKKTIPGEQDSYQFGDIVPFKITVDVPLDILDYKKFIISDVADLALVYQNGSLELTESGASLDSAIYQLTAEKHGFTINFIDIKALEKYAGKTLTVTYKMKLVTTSSETDQFVNEATLETDHETLHSDVDVVTGGRRFVKVDLNNQEKKLAGARFQVLNQKQQVLIKTAEGFAWSDDSQDEGLVVLKSDQAGYFEINGLSYGDYQLKELTAPTGYKLNPEPMTFSVLKGSYTAGAKGVLKVVNLKTPEPGTPRSPTSPSGETKRYPKTGEIISHSLIGLGIICILAGVVILYKKKIKE